MKVWTNGCFDVLHRGHIELFRYARSLGDELIVGSFISKFGSPLIFYYICIFSKLNRPQKIYSILFLISQTHS